ncbi:MAG: hypothetical protein PUB21_12265 [Bacteroidales bacterium]|nr:hypothetical protein [Bacteroidales bacterium]
MRKKIRHFMSGGAVMFLMLLYTLSSYSQNQNIKLLSIDSSEKEAYFEPFEKLALIGIENGKTVKVFDAKGLEYVSLPVSDTLSFSVAGNLGKQAVVVYDKKGKEVARRNFMVDAKTKIDDGGRYTDMFNLFYKGMLVYSPTGVEHTYLDGKRINYFVPWGLDHYHTLKGMQYFSPVGYDFLDLMREKQRKDGMIWSFILKDSEHYFETCYGPFGYFLKGDGKAFLARQPIENHCEYIYVNSVYQVWKASGDMDWMKKSLSSCAKALDYSVTDIDRYSERYGLLKRVYTIDSWDFQAIDKYLPNVGLNNSMLIHPYKSKFGIFYGDNTGYADACDQLSEMFRRVGDNQNADKYRQRAAKIRTNLNKIAWNGRFFTHFVEEDDSVVRDFGVDEKSQISLSNCYSVNRGLSHDQNKAIIESYMQLKENLPKGSPGEWYAIYPPFEKGFSVHNDKWQYMNGGIAGHAAGELARGAYENGYEEYATDVLNRLQDLGHRSGDRIWFAYTGAFEDPAVPNYTTVDIKKFANMDILANSRGKALNWMGTENPGDDLANIPVGNQVFDGKKFHLIDPETNNYRSVVGISSEKGFAHNVEIPVGQFAECVYLMHSGVTRNKENVYASVTFLYEDGSTTSDYLVRGKHLSQWWYPGISQPNAGVAWRGPNEKTGDVGVYWVALDNPNPEKKIKSLIFNSAVDNSLYILMGITLSDQKHYVKAKIESTGGPDNWAAGTAMFAMIEGLAGIKDQDVAFNAPVIAPRWITTGSDKVKVVARYAASDGYVAYEYNYSPDQKRMVIDITGNAPSMSFHILLPEGVRMVEKVMSDGKELPVTYSEIEKSRYADFSTDIKGIQQIIINF